MSRSGAEFFLNPSTPTQRRYEALRAYLVDGLTAREAGRRFGYSAATIYQLASDFRAGHNKFFTQSKSGPRTAPKTAALMSRVLELRATGGSITEIAERLRAEGEPLSAQSVW